MKQIENEVFDLSLQYVKDNNINIYDVVYDKQGKDMCLTIYIDSDNGISIDDCEKFSQYIDPIIDEKINIKEQYFLEVSSAGLERTLRSDKHFEDNINTLVSVHLYKPQDKKKEFIGILKQYNGNEIIIDCDGNEYTFNMKDISIVKTVFDWNNERGNKDAK